MANTLRNRNDAWVDSTRTVFDGSTDGYESVRIALLGNLGETLTVNDRMMATGFDIQGQLVINGVPFAKYDVICYLSGQADTPAPTNLLVPVESSAEEAGAEKKPKKKKRRGPAPKGPMPIKLNVNGKEFTAPAGGNHHRWNGYFTQISDANPNGNVAIVEGLNGASVTIKLEGSLLAGFQIVERK